MVKKNKPTNAWGIAGLIAGIIGLLLLFIIPNIGILFSIAAVVFSVIQKKYKSTGVATAGLVLGLIGIIFYVIVRFAFFRGPYSEIIGGIRVNVILGILTIIIGLFMVISSILKSEFIIYKLLVARSKILWGKNAHNFLMISGILIIIMGILMTIGIIG